MDKIVKLKTDDGKLVSPITLYMQFRNANPKTLRGDKYTDMPREMVINLFRHAIKNTQNTIVMIIYDNRKSKHMGEDIVLKWYCGNLTIDNTSEYGIDSINHYRY